MDSSPVISLYDTFCQSLRYTSVIYTLALVNLSDGASLQALRQ